MQPAVNYSFDRSREKRGEDQERAQKPATTCRPQAHVVDTVARSPHAARCGPHKLVRRPHMMENCDWKLTQILAWGITLARLHALTSRQSCALVSFTHGPVLHLGSVVRRPYLSKLHPFRCCVAAIAVYYTIVCHRLGCCDTLFLHVVVVRRSSFAVRRSSFAVRRSPFAVRRSLFVWLCQRHRRVWIYFEVRGRGSGSRRRWGGIILRHNHFSKNVLLSRTSGREKREKNS